MGFASRSLLVLMALYGMVFALVDVALLDRNAPLWVGLAFVVVLIGVQYLAAPWLIQRLFTINFDDDAVPAAQREFVERLCRERGLPMPKLGLIYSGTPNAFAFGRLRKDARIAVTDGLLKICTEEESNAVLAHELGHIAHYDFAVMAMASMAPLLLYQIYAWTRRINNHGRVVSYFAYLAYWVGQFLVLVLNRTREYGADHFSAEVTREPSALAAALVKIGYGMVQERSEQLRLTKEGASAGHKKDARKQLEFGQTLGLMGIAAASNNDALALAMDNPEAAAKVMRWDLQNPWSRVYELSSTHPLTAMRVRALNKVSANMGQGVEYPLPTDSGKAVRLRWVGFPLEFALWAAPFVSGFLFVSWLGLHRSFAKIGWEIPETVVPWLLIATGVTWAVKIAFRYHGRFQPKKTGELLDDMDVSQMRPRAVEMTGEVIGNGVPGAFWSPDLVLRDETGLMFLYYRSTVPLGRLVFALRHADRLVGEQVRVWGWYRRGVKPYVEIARVEARVSKARTGRGMTTLFGGEEVTAPVVYEPMLERSYSRWIQLALAGNVAAAGIIWLLAIR